MRFLFLGNGNITNALLGITEWLGEREEWDITVSDIKDGILFTLHRKCDIVKGTIFGDSSMKRSNELTLSGNNITDVCN